MPRTAFVTAVLLSLAQQAKVSQRTDSVFFLLLWHRTMVLSAVSMFGMYSQALLAGKATQPEFLCVCVLSSLCGLLCCFAFPKLGNHQKWCSVLFLLLWGHICWVSPCWSWRWALCSAKLGSNALCNWGWCEHGSVVWACLFHLEHK